MRHDTGQRFASVLSGLLSANTTVSAAFEAIPTTLTVAASPGGSVAAAASEHRFDRWTLSGGRACADGTATNLCALPAKSVTAAGRVSAVFIVQGALTVVAGANGSVVAEVDGTAVVTVIANSSHPFASSVLSAAALTATEDGGYALTG